MREMIKYQDYLIGILADYEEAVAYLETSQEEYQKDGDTVAFLSALQSVAEAQVGNNELLSQVYLLSGGVHHLRKEYDWAIEDYSTVIELKPNDADVYYNRGMAYHYTGEYDHAIEDFNTAIQLNPDNAEVYIRRGLEHHHKGEYDHAIEDYTKAIQLNPDNAEGYSYRGMAYCHKNKHDLAIEDFSKAIEPKPDYADLVTVRDMGRNIITSFRNAYENALGVNLSERNTAMPPSPQV